MGESTGLSIEPCGSNSRRSNTCNADSRTRPLMADATIPRIGVFIVSRDRLAIEVKGLTAAPDAAVNGADCTRDRAAGNMHVVPGAEPAMTSKSGDGEAVATMRSRRGSPMPAASRLPIMAMSTRRSITPRPCSIRAPRTTSPIAAAINMAGAARRHRKRSQTGARGPRGPAMRRRRAAAVRARRRRHGAAVGAARRRSRSRHRQRLCPDTQALRHHPHPLRHRHDLLRPGDRRRRSRR